MPSTPNADARVDSQDLHTPPAPRLARCIMVLGCSSGAGKSWLATALCRYYANQGLRVAPFKAQNMSNNARVVPAAHGAFGEIGSAQYFQALAARATPDVRMNPLLLKPEADTRSQIVLMGHVEQTLTDMPWRSRAPHVWPHIADALESLRATHDVVVIEGAGSPAEINLMDSDVVNLRVARHADARCLLVADIDRGGAFAHLYGTWALLPPDDRARLAGFVLNKFRGDASLLAPAPAQLQAMTGVPVAGVIPMQRGHGLPEEDGVFDNATVLASMPHTRPAAAAQPVVAPVSATAPASAAAPDEPMAVPASTAAPIRHIAIVAYPHISNLDEFQPLKHIPHLRLIWARTPQQLEQADTIILPGSKSTVADLAWLRAQRLDAAITAHAAAGGRILGICGGLQMLGEALIDLHGVEGTPRTPSGAHALADSCAAGLGLLPLVTHFAPHKTVRTSHARFGKLHGAWQALSGLPVAGYEIHAGHTVPHAAMHTPDNATRTLIPQVAWQSHAGQILGLYIHGLFESADILAALFGSGITPLEAVFDQLAATVQTAFGSTFLNQLTPP